jgi:hypothetical protein
MGNKMGNNEEWSTSNDFPSSEPPRSKKLTELQLQPRI